MPPAAAALIPMNSRREKRFLIICTKPPDRINCKSEHSKIELPTRSFLQHLDCDFLEEHDVVVAMILQADVAFLRTRPALRFKVEFSGGDRITLGELGHFHAVYTTFVCGPSRVISMVFHSGPGLPGLAIGLVRE